MKITLEKAKDGIGRFHCSITMSFPALEELYSIETEGKNGKEEAELRGYHCKAIGEWLENYKATCPLTRKNLKLETLGSCNQLFSLVLAAVEASGHLDAVKQEEDFKAFADSSDYGVALKAGRTLLAALVAAPGANLKAKIEFLELPELRGSGGQIRLLQHTLGFELAEFANYREPGQTVVSNQFAEDGDEPALGLAASLERAIKAWEEEAAILAESRRHENEGQANERARLEIEAADAQKALDEAIDRSDEIGALSALQRQTEVEVALAALPGRFRLLENGPVIRLAANRLGVGLVDVNAPVPPLGAAAAVFSLVPPGEPSAPPIFGLQGVDANGARH